MRLRFFLPSAAAALVLATAAPPLAFAAASSQPASTPVLTIHVTANVANPGSVILETNGGSIIGSCLGSSTPGTATCAFPITANSGVLLFAQANPGKGFSFWQGTTQCKAAPGPVCHVEVYTARVTVTATYGLTGAGPLVTTTRPAVVGDAPLCSTPGSDTVTANGTGFPASTPITLSDNGTQVASGNTDSSGFGQLTYTAGSEAAVYRTLVMGAGGQTATTDVFAISEFCQYQNVAGGKISLNVVVTDMDANRTQDFYKFGTHPRIGVKANASGVGSATSPAYACASGTVTPFVFTGKRGTGTPAAFHFTNGYNITC